MFVFFFFKQKTAYEMRISDWSSDVCSSDLAVFLVLEPAVQAARVQLGGVACPPVERQGCADPLARYVIIAIFELFEEGNAVLLLPAFGLDIRSEEHTSELQSLMRISYAVFCLKKKKQSQCT